MPSSVRRSSHLSRHLESLRLKRGLRPGQLAASLGASNVSKVGSLIRAFELGEPLSNYWLEKLISQLQPDPVELKSCLKRDQAEAEQQLQQKRLAWIKWSDVTIDPFLTIRYMPAVYGVHELPKAFCNSRQEAEDWAADELKRFRAKGFLTWSRREQTLYEKGGSNRKRYQVSFDEPPASAWMQLGGSKTKFLLKDGSLLSNQL